ncbi:PLP-dependent transferase, partial [Staphylococcus aureus]
SLNRLNIEFTTGDTTKLERSEGAIQSTTKLIYLETPSNPCFKITDIKAGSKIAEKHELLVAVYNTLMTPLGQAPILLGSDIVIHSATKFLSGHSDVIAGAVITNNEAISEALFLIQNGTGKMLSA